MRKKEWEQAIELLNKTIEQRVLLTKAVSVISPSKMKATRRLLAGKMDISSTELKGINGIIEELNAL